MIYLSEFHLQTADNEWQFLRKRSKGCYESFYPYKWTELSNVRIYHEFFKTHADEFE